MGRRVTDLPPELIQYAISLVGQSVHHYSVKERQSDLVSFALVHSTFRGPTESCLYVNPTIRNEGRSALFLRTLEAHPGLAPLVLHLAYPASSLQDRSSPTVLNRILGKTSPTAISLGAALFCHEESSRELGRILCSRDNIESIALSALKGQPALFSLPTATPFLAPALSNWNSLTRLGLTGTLAIPEAILRGAKPNYHLIQLELMGGEVSSLELEWLLGCSHESLRDLRLRGITGSADSDEGTIFSPESLLYKILPSLERLTLVNISNEGKATAPLARVGGANLVYLHIGDTVACSTPLDYLPETLIHLVIEGRAFFESLALAEIIEKKRNQVGFVTIIGSFKLSDPSYTSFARLCHDHKIRLEVKKQF